MKPVDKLEKCFKELFRSSEDENHSADEMQALLKGIDFPLLLRYFNRHWIPLFEYQISSDLEKGFRFHGSELIPEKAVLVYTNTVHCIFDAALHERRYELWLMMDYRFVIVSCIRTIVKNYESVITYRTVKSLDWRDTGITMDFPFIAGFLKFLCDAERNHKLLFP